MAMTYIEPMKHAATATGSTATTTTKRETEAGRRRLAAAERAEAIRVLGMTPEPEGIGSGHPEAYAATTGELVTWARQAQAKGEGR